MNRLRPKTWTWLILLLTLAPVRPAGAGEPGLADGNPRLAPPPSRLDDPFAGPIFLTGHVALGGEFSRGHGQIGYGASIIFRPGAAVNFLHLLYPHSAMVLRIDHQRLAGSGDRLLAGDLVLRHYLTGEGVAERSFLPFLGLGFGATDVRLSGADGGGNSRYWSWLVEGGQEWQVGDTAVLVARAQFRRFSYGGVKVVTWSVSGAVGIPLPW